MLKRWNDYDNTRVSTTTRPLPTGGYVGKIMGVQTGQYSDGRQCLIVSVDITEGDYIGYYTDRYRTDPATEKKWKGNIRLTVPADDGSERDARDKTTFKSAMVAVEESNPGYHWDWDETKLKGKAVGFLVRQKEWEFKGSTGWSPEVYRLLSCDDVRQGNFKKIADKPLQARNIANAAEEIANAEGDLPF